MTILSQYLIGLILSLLIHPLFYWITSLMPNLGWGLFIVMILHLLLFQITFYYLTTKNTVGWTLLNYILNFTFWVGEIQFLNAFFLNENFYSKDEYHYKIDIICGLLWVTNKIMIDQLFKRIRSIAFRLSRLDRIILKIKQLPLINVKNN